MKTTTNSEKYIESIYRRKKNEEQNAIELFEQRTNIKTTKKYGKHYIVIDEVFTDKPTRQISLFFKYIGYGSVIFLGNINGKTKEKLRYKNTEIQKETESLILKLNYINQEVEQATQEVFKTHGKPKTPIGIIRDRIFYN